MNEAVTIMTSKWKTEAKKLSAAVVPNLVMKEFTMKLKGKKSCCGF